MLFLFTDMCEVGCCRRGSVFHGNRRDCSGIVEIGKCAFSGSKTNVCRFSALIAAESSSFSQSGFAIERHRLGHKGDSASKE